MSDNITLPREVVVQAVKVLSPMAYDTWPRERNEVVEALRTALAAPHPEPVRHPGYVIGNHWLETAYQRLCAGEAEDAILEDYELVREPRLRELRLNAERLRDELRQSGIDHTRAEIERLKAENEALRRDAESLESLYHPATEILIEGLKKIGTEDAKRVLSAWDSGREIFDNRFLSRRDKR